MLTIKIFISSPGDVAMERASTEKVIRRLAIEYGGRVDVKPFFWEHEPMRASASFNEPENIPSTSEFDIVVCILWSRLGTMLSEKFRRPDGRPYPSGTAFEVETAMDSYKKKKAPDLLVYRRREGVTIPLDAEERRRKLEQIEALEAFLREHFFNADNTFKAAITEHQSLGEFEARLHKHLSKLIESRLESALATAPAAGRPVTWHAGNPFRGLEPYAFEHADVFFGRSQNVADVIKIMRSEAQTDLPITVVHGASGSGKSSLVRAGVIPMLMKPGVGDERVAYWCRAEMIPSQAAHAGGLIGTLAAALLREPAMPALASLGCTQESLTARLSNNAVGVISLVVQALSQQAEEVRQNEHLVDRPDARLVLLIDQLEEVLTDDRRFPLEQRQAFAAALTALAQSGVVWIVATMRTDQLGNLDAALPGLASKCGQYLLLAPTESDLGMMIRLPAAAAGVELETDPRTGHRLEDRLLKEARGSPDGLPLLSFALQQMYDEAGPAPDGSLMRKLTHAQLDAKGGLQGYVQEQANKVFQAFIATQVGDGEAKARTALDRLTRRLASIGADKDAPVLRRTARLDDLEKQSDISPLIAALVEGRLLTVNAGADGARTVSVSHEALFRCWSEIGDSIERNRDFLVLRGRAASAAAVWKARERAPSFLWFSGGPLDDARSLAQWGDDVDQEELAFAQASLAEAARLERDRVESQRLAALAAAEERRARNRRTALIASAAACIVFVGGGIGWWLMHKRQGEIQQRMDSAVSEAVEKKKENQELAGTIAKNAEVQDLEEQLRAAQASLFDSQTNNDLNNEWTHRVGMSPTLTIRELAARLKKHDPENREAFAAQIRATVMDPEADIDSIEIRQGLDDWEKHGLPKEELLLLRGEILWRKEDIPGALAMFDSYLKSPATLKSPARGKLYERVAETLEEKQKWPEARQTLDAWIEWMENDGSERPANPKLASKAFARRAIIAAHDMDVEGARSFLRRAEQADRENSEIWNARPKIERLEREAGGLKEASAAVASASGANRALALLGRIGVYIKIGRSDLAVADVEEVAKTFNGSSVTAILLRALCQSSSGGKLPANSSIIVPAEWGGFGLSNWWDQNVERLRDLVKADDTMVKTAGSVDARLSRANALFMIQQFDLAKIDVDVVLAAEPENASAVLLKASGLARTKKFEDALLVVLPESAPVQARGVLTYIRAVCQGNLGRLRDAMAEVDKALALLPNDANCLKLKTQLDQALSKASNQ